MSGGVGARAATCAFVDAPRARAVAGGVMSDASDALWKKLNLKPGVRVAVTDAYGAMTAHVAALDAAHGVTGAPEADTGFFVALATTLAEVAEHARTAAALGGDDPVVWLAYPKGTSKRHRCEFNRDTGWSAMGEAGFEPVRQVAIDDDWSALRFRRVRHIGSMTRAFAMTAEGKAKAAKGRSAKG